MKREAKIVLMNDIGRDFFVDYPLENGFVVAHDFRFRIEVVRCYGSNLNSVSRRDLVATWELAGLRASQQSLREQESTAIGQH